MALPQQIQRQAAQVEEYERQLAEGAQPVDPAATEQPDPSPPAAPEPQAPVVAPAPAEPNREAQLAEQRYRSLQGMYNQETRKVAFLNGQVNTLNEQLAHVTEQVTQLKAKPPTEPTAANTELDDKFGPDLVDMARRVAREEFGTREQKYQAQITQLQQQLGQEVGKIAETQQQSSQERFFFQLAQAVPAWEEIQASDTCQKWLSDRVPGAKFTWNDVLVNAANSNDAAGAVEVFQTFIAAHRPPAPPAPAAPPAAPRRNDLSRQVSPQKSSASAASAPADKRTYSAADYAAESQKMIKLSKAGKHQESAAIDAELNAALSEGRVRP